MRFILLLPLLTATCFAQVFLPHRDIPPSPSAALDCSLTNAMLSWWKFEETSGNRLNSVAGARTLTNVSTTSFETGRVGNAYQSAAAGYMTSSSDASVKLTNAFTIGAWIYFDDLTNVNQVIINKSGEYELWWQASTTSFNIAAGLSVINTNSYLSNPNLRVWHCVVAYWNPTNTTLGVFVNGIYSQKTATGTPVTGSSAITVAGLAGPAQAINGRLDQLILWDRCLSTNEINTFYSTGLASCGNQTLNQDQFAWWNTLNGVITEESVIQSNKLYVPTINLITPNTGNGLAIVDARLGTTLKYYAITNQGGGAPYVAGGKIYCYQTVAGRTWKIDEATGAFETNVNNGAASLDMSALKSDGTNAFLPFGGQLRALRLSDFSWTWTNTSVILTGDQTAKCSPPLIVTNVLYFMDNNAKLWKLNPTDGTSSGSIDFSASSVSDSYNQLIYDKDNAKIYIGDSLGMRIYAIDPSTMLCTWSNAIPATGFASGGQLFRGSAYANNRLYVTARSVATNPYKSKVFCLDVTSSGAILWTNTLAFDNNAQISGMVVDDSILHCTTFDYNANGKYNRVFGLNIADGTVAYNYDTAYGASSPPPVAWGGKLYSTYWTYAGMSAMNIRANGQQTDMPWSADEYQSRYVAPWLSGALISH